MSAASDAVGLLRWVALHVNGQPQLAEAARRCADQLETDERIRQGFIHRETCRSCGDPIVNVSMGRPRDYCRVCRPPKSPEKVGTSKGLEHDY